MHSTLGGSTERRHHQKDSADTRNLSIQAATMTEPSLKGRPAVRFGEVGETERETETERESNSGFLWLADAMSPYWLLCADNPTKFLLLA